MSLLIKLHISIALPSLKDAFGLASMLPGGENVTKSFFGDNPCNNTWFPQTLNHHTQLATLKICSHIRSNEFDNIWHVQIIKRTNYWINEWKITTKIEYKSVSLRSISLYFFESVPVSTAWTTNYRQCPGQLVFWLLPNYLW